MVTYKVNPVRNSSGALNPAGSETALSEPEALLSRRLGRRPAGIILNGSTFIKCSIGSGSAQEGLLLRREQWGIISNGVNQTMEG